MVGVVAHDHAQLGRHLAGGEAGQQVGEAVRLAGGEDGDAGHVVAERDADVHAEVGGDRGEGRGDLVAGQREAVEVELDPLEEDAGGGVGVLVGVEDVAAVGGDEVGDGRDEPRAGRGR